MSRLDHKQGCNNLNDVTTFAKYVEDNSSEMMEVYLARAVIRLAEELRNTRADLAFLETKPS